MQARPIADGIFSLDPAPVLWGARHRETGRVVFPPPEGPDAGRLEIIPLASTGTLWSWTIQRFRPKSPPYTGPAQFVPFALGYVALPDQVIVESRLTGIAFDQLRIGMALRLTTIGIDRDADGMQVMLYAFEPAEAAAP